MLVSARLSSLQMRSGLFVAPELHDWLLLFYSLRLCLVYARLCMSAWVHLQFALTSSKTKLLSRILNQRDAAAVHLWDGSSNRIFFFFSDSAYVSMLDGKLYKMFIDVHSSEAELVYPLRGGCGSLQSERPLDKFTVVIFIQPHHCRSS